MDDRPIGIFDSGIGGLTVFSEIIKALPSENIIYLGDTKQFPYGNKSKKTIIDITKENINYLIKKNVKLIVIACGTATSQALEEVKDKYNIPIIGIIKPTVMYLAKEKNIRKIGIMATAGTIRSNSWEKEIKKLMPNAKVINKACPLLAPMVEEGWTDNEIARLVIKEYVKVFKEETVDSLILGCTHYPLLKNLIQEELGNKVKIIDTGKQVGKFLEELLHKEKINGKPKNIPNYKFYLTEIEEGFIKVANNLIPNTIDNINFSKK